MVTLYTNKKIYKILVLFSNILHPGGISEENQHLDLYGKGYIIHTS